MCTMHADKVLLKAGACWPWPGRCLETPARHPERGGRRSEYFGGSWTRRSRAKTREAIPAACPSAWRRSAWWAGPAAMTTRPRPGSAPAGTTGRRRARWTAAAGSGRTRDRCEPEIDRTWRHPSWRTRLEALPAAVSALLQSQGDERQTMKASASARRRQGRSLRADYTNST